jgi:hypothetical protein
MVGRQHKYNGKYVELSDTEHPWFKEQEPFVNTTNKEPFVGKKKPKSKKYNNFNTSLIWIIIAIIILFIFCS